MTDTWDLWDDDDLLETELRRLATLADPVPDAVLAVAMAGLAWRTMDAELAELSYDSLLEGAGIGMRGGGSRELTIETGGFIVDVQVADGPGGGGDLLGQLVPSQSAVVEIRTPGGVTEVMADGLGRFHAALPGSGPMSLRCRLGDGSTTIATDWVTV